MKKRILLFFIILSQVTFAQSVKKTMKRLPDTGQNTSYTNTFGEDNDYSFNVPFYINNGDGTITDTITGLMWQRTDGGEMTIDSAHKYVQSLTLATYSDWRLPSIAESFSLLNLQMMNPALNILYFPNTTAEYWWCLDTAFNNPSKIWVTNAGGGQGPHPKSETISAGGNKRFHTRAVRDINIPSIITQRFTDNGDSTITDNLTGLTWQKFGTNDTMSWENALQRAESSTTANYTDWRLPNIKELESINNVKANAPSVYTTFFPNLKAANYWSNTTQFNHSTNAWYIDFKNFGLTTYMDKSARSAYIICVRNINKSTTAITSQTTTNKVVAFYCNENKSLTILPSQQFKNSLLSVFNSSGQQIFTTTITGINSAEKFEIPLPPLTTGIYTYSLKNDGQISSGKFSVNNY